MKKFLVPGILALYCVIAGSGSFIGPNNAGLPLFVWLAGYLLTAFSVAYRSLFSSEPFRPFPFFILAVILLNFFIQMTGGVHSFLWPAYYVFASLAAVFLPLLQTLAITGLILAIEAGNLFFSGQGELGRLPMYAGFAVSLWAVPAVLSVVMRRIRAEAERVRDKHERLIEQADAIDPFGDRDTIEALTRENQLASSIKTARSLESAFAGLIAMIYEFVPAHTYALFLKEAAGEADALVLRARRSDSGERDLAPIGELLQPDKDHGIISGCVRTLHPQYLPDIRQTLGTLGYYTRSMPIRSLLAIPIEQDGSSTGVLVVDSLEAGAFSLDTQDMLSRFAPFFLQIIDRIRVSQELSARAATLSAMHKMSVVLNSTLELGEMLSRVAREINVLAPYDFCLFLQYDEKSRMISIAHRSGTVELTEPGRSVMDKLASSIKAGKDVPGEAQRQPFPLKEGTLVNQMLNQWGQGQSAPYHFFDLSQRRVLGLFDTTTGLNRQIRSLSCWPLVTGEKFIGAFFLGSLRPEAFSEFHRSLLETLSNHIALVMDNAILHQQISNLARTDGLTGLLNHRTFMERLGEEYKRIDRQERPFSILLMDIDKFKSVNDTYGHPVGDQAIKAVAKVLKDTVRTTDFVARYGGEEFAVGMVDTDCKGARQMAERVRSIMEKTVATRVGSRDLLITLSIGVASFPEDTKNMIDLVTMADDALYEAKRSGRNRVCLQKDVNRAETVTRPKVKR